MTDKKSAVAKRDIDVVAVSTDQGRLFDDEALAGITNFSDAVAEFGGKAEVFDDVYGDGTTELSQDGKKDLVGVPFFILEWSFYVGDYGDNFVHVVLITQNNQKYRFSDGSAGVRAQLEMVTAKRTESGHGSPLGGLLVRRGLSESKYPIDADGKPIPRGSDVKPAGMGCTLYLS